MRAGRTLIVLGALLGCPSSDTAMQDPSDFRWPSGTGALPSASAVTYHPGTPAVVASATIDAAKMP